MALDPIKVEISNAQFPGDITCMTPLPRDLAAIRRCTKCLIEMELPGKRKEGALVCPNCGSNSLERKFRVKARTYTEKNGKIKGRPYLQGIFDANPYVEDFDGDADIVLRLGTNLGCKGSNTSGDHICMAFHRSFEAKTGWKVPRGELLPDLHLSESEKRMPPLVEGKYWVICIGKRPPFTSKYWPVDRWQAVVDALPEITFVQIGHSEHEHVELIGDNVINMIGKTQDPVTGIRDLFRLVYHAEGCCSLVSFLMHVAAGFHKPCVIPAGAREPVRFEMYPFHRYIHWQGAMNCSGITPGGCISSSVLINVDMLNDGKLPSNIYEILVKQPQPLGDNCQVIARPDRGMAWEIKSDGGSFYIGNHEDNLSLYHAKYRHHAGNASCWKASADACPNLVDGYPECMLMVEVGEVVKAIQSYYVGGALEPASKPAMISTHKQPVMKLVCNAHAWGGGERSASWLATRMLEEGYEVQLLPTGNVNDNFRKALSPYVKIADPDHPITEPCELMLVYTNDMTYGFENKYALLENIQAERKVMVLNYRLGGAGKIGWTKTWDKYIFLCSDMEQEFKTRVLECNSVVLPPPVDLKPFLDVNLGSLNRTLHVVRVGSQTSQKMPTNIRDIVEKIKAVHPSVTFTFMGGHPSLDDLDYVTNIQEYSQPVIDVLRKGCVFWYMLPYEPNRYLDNGPRVIMEAMAAGLPVIADNWGGAKDRVTQETGWLCNNVDEHIKVFADIDGRTLNIKGQAAKERARTQFDPDRWIEAILND